MFSKEKKVEKLLVFQKKTWFRPCKKVSTIDRKLMQNQSQKKGYQKEPKGNEI